MEDVANSVMVPLPWLLGGFSVAGAVIAFLFKMLMDSINSRFDEYKATRDSLDKGTEAMNNLTTMVNHLADLLTRGNN